MLHTNVIKGYDQWMIGKLHRQLWKGTQYDRYSKMSCKYMSSVSDSHYQNQTQSRITICVTLLEIQIPHLVSGVSFRDNVLNRITMFIWHYNLENWKIQ